jgi:hypothetical protein
MKKNLKLRYFILLAAAHLALLMSGCTEETFMGNEPRRTILVYIAGENSLTGFAESNMGAMIRGAVGKLNGGYLLIYMDRKGALPCLLRIKADDPYELSISVDTIKMYEEQNSVDADVMKRVLGDVFRSTQFETSSKGLILWSHGTGWLPQNPQNYLRIWGQDTGNNEDHQMEINTLRDALADYKGESRFDFILFDACYMGSIEVFYALRNNAEYIMGSPTEVMGDGLPYSKTVKTFFAAVDVKDALVETARTFYEHYNQQEQVQNGTPSASVAVVRTSELDALADISKEIFSGKYSTDVQNINLGQVQIMERLGYRYNLLYDFRDFARQIATAEQYERFTTIMNNAIIYKATTANAFYGYPSGSGTWSPIDADRFCGLSSYAPQKYITTLNDWYKQLDWYKAVYE